jgi:8-oxo-dGTP pyrophosphatase MutT (NUDIX family)
MHKRSLLWIYRFFLNDVRLNIRSAVIIETENGYISDQDRLDGFYYAVGGRIKINETSEEAAKREIYEEIEIMVKDIKLKAIMESFLYMAIKDAMKSVFIINTK